MSLPTFEEMRRNAFKLLGDAQDELRSDWAPGTGPNNQQVAALQRARAAISQAKNALDAVARAGR
jgi:hypothetical protein